MPTLPTKRLDYVKEVCGKGSSCHRRLGGHGSGYRKALRPRSDASRLHYGRGKDGIIRAADVNADYTIRLEPAETLRGLRMLTAIDR